MTGHAATDAREGSATVPSRPELRHSVPALRFAHYLTRIRFADPLARHFVPCAGLSGLHSMKIPARQASSAAPDRKQVDSAERGQRAAPALRVDIGHG
ncbi:MAG: hypothetical protein [Bacteriophage sp.]|nr:MAG: hypothetical protein [Bacteriophage sp.]